jgi:aminopeptidase N
MVNCYLSIKITKIIKILNIKGYPSSHPVIKPINNVYDIEEAFDSVETAKVAAILRMIEYEIGEQIMWNAIGVYIE